MQFRVSDLPVGFQTEHDRPPEPGKTIQTRAVLGKLEYINSTCFDSRNIDSVIHHVSQPDQVLKCPEFVSIIRLNHFLH